MLFVQCECLPPGYELDEGSEGTFHIDLQEGVTDIDHYWLAPTYDESLAGEEFDL